MCGGMTQREGLCRDAVSTSHRRRPDQNQGSDWNRHSFWLSQTTRQRKILGVLIFLDWGEEVVTHQLASPSCPPNVEPSCLSY